MVSGLDGDRYVKSFTTRNQLAVLLYAQASGKSSLREIEVGLQVQSSRLYHVGLTKPVTRSTLADANAKRSYQIYEKLFYTLLERCRRYSPPKKSFRFANPLYSLDATMIDLCLESFPWARYKARKGALRMHCMLDHAGEIPAFVFMTDGKTQEITTARAHLPIIPDSIYCFDKAYTDYAWFQRITDEGAFFVTRAKDNMNGQFLGQQEDSKNKDIVFDQIIELAPPQHYSGKLRRIGLFDAETGVQLEFLTNNFTLAASTIARIYKSRWQIEVFFKWIKQNLKIKSFLGTSKNAVMTQVWVAMCYYLLLSYVKFQANYSRSLTYLHDIVREALMMPGTLFDLLKMNAARVAALKRQDLQLRLQV